MPPPDAQRRPAGESRAAEVVPCDWTVPQSLRDRRDAALRLAPYTNLWGLPGRDPFCPERDPAPSTFGLRRHELEAEVARQREAGWSSDELRQVFINPAEVSA